MKKEFASVAAKEVHSYADALKHGYDLVFKNKLLTNNMILDIQSMLIENKAGFRKVPGTSLKNAATNQIIYEPPQEPTAILEQMNNLEKFVNEVEISDLDPLIKMAIIHHQFESIHPFYDGNGRTGRIINILYLMQQDLLNTPILYLSRFINKNKSQYYKLLQSVRDDDTWEEWVLFMLEGVEETSIKTTRLISVIKALMLEYKHKMRSELPKIYSQDLLNLIFRHPYTKIQHVETEMRVSRITATRYLDELIRINLLSKLKKGREDYFINTSLTDLLSMVAEL